MKKNILTASVLFCCALLIACGSDNGGETETGAQTSTPVTEAKTELRYKEHVPAADFGGVEFRVASIASGTQNYGLDYEEDSGDLVQSATYKRNRAIEDRYNFRFVCDFVDEYMDAQPLLKEQALAGDDNYQLIMMICREAFSSAIEGYILPYSEIPYIDPTQPWYMKHVNDMLSVNGQHILLYTDECMSAHTSLSAVFFNKQLVNNLDMADPYQLVRNGTWTQDVFYQMAAEAIYDVDGNGKFEVGDRFGISSESDLFFPAMWVGSTIYTVEKDQNDLPVFTAPGNEKLLSVMDELLEQIDTNGMYLDSFETYEYKEECRATGKQYFADGNALFRFDTVAAVNELRGMEADFGILPPPKYEESQDTYYGRMLDGWLHVPPTSVQNTELLGTVLEALGAESKNYVIPAFFDVALTDKLTRDTDSEEMLNLIFDHVVLDLGDTIWFSAIRSQMTQQLVKNRPVAASFLIKMEKSVQKEIDKILEYTME